MHAADTSPISTPRALAKLSKQFLRSRNASLLTHACLVVLTAVEFALLLRLPFWIAFVPCALIHHRIGVLLHEYIHGIPFARYRHNLAVLSVFDGMMLMFGSLDLFRGTHLAHHRWLNTENDPAVAAERPKSGQGGVVRWVSGLEAVQHLIYLVEAFHGRHPYVSRSRIISGAMLSVAWIGFWVWAGRADLVGKLLVLTLFNTLGPVSLRGALEHHSHPGDSAFANEYPCDHPVVQSEPARAPPRGPALSVVPSAIPHGEAALDAALLHSLVSRLRSTSPRTDAAHASNTARAKRAG